MPLIRAPGGCGTSRAQAPRAMPVMAGGPGRDATWNGPKGIAYAPDGSLYIADTENHVIRRVSLRDGLVTTVAGAGRGVTGLMVIRCDVRWRGRTGYMSAMGCSISGTRKTTVSGRCAYDASLRSLAQLRTCPAGHAPATSSTM